ncbi:MAG TPA: tetratricopeptide repeat protein [Campylobacterales bacterium]|nr:tetratricopeptide repeat protein [Campylobacterales bacterium]
MSIQDTIQEAKKEFTSDEQMLVSAFKLEKFYKKNKVLIFATIAAIVLFFGGRAIMNTMDEMRLESANQAYLELLKDPSNQGAATTLQEKNPELYQLYSYNQAVKNRDLEKLKALSSSDNAIIADISNYHLAILENRQADSEIYKDIAMMNNAKLLIDEGKIEEAKSQLAQIEETSPVYNMVKIMEHYTIKGK